ncbi:unnamed protein product, partial [Closterium sp. NIES-54]
DWQREGCLTPGQQKQEERTQEATGERHAAEQWTDEAPSGERRTRRRRLTKNLLKERNEVRSWPCSNSRTSIDTSGRVLSTSRSSNHRVLYSSSSSSTSSSTSSTSSSRVRSTRNSSNARVLSTSSTSSSTASSNSTSSSRVRSTRSSVNSGDPSTSSSAPETDVPSVPLPKLWGRGRLPPWRRNTRTTSSGPTSPRRTPPEAAVP